LFDEDLLQIYNQVSAVKFLENLVAFGKSKGNTHNGYL